MFALSNGRQILLGLVTGSFAPINLQPSGRDQNFPFRLEGLALHTGNPSGILVLRRRKEHGHEALGYHVEERALLIVERARNSCGRNNRKVIADLRVIKDALVWLDPIIVEHSSRKWVVDPIQCRSDCRKIIFRQSARIRARIRDRLVLFIKRLGNLQRAFCREPKPIIRFALQCSEIVELRSNLRTRFLFFQLDDTVFAAALPLDGFSDFAVPQSRRGAMLVPEGAV